MQVLVPNSPDPGVVHYNGRYYAVTTTYRPLYIFLNN
jgi:hypothetical protein